MATIDTDVTMPPTLITEPRSGKHRIERRMRVRQVFHAELLQCKNLIDMQHGLAQRRRARCDLSDWHKDEAPIEAGLLDIGRYQNL